MGSRDQEMTATEKKVVVLENSLYKLQKVMSIFDKKFICERFWIVCESFLGRFCATVKYSVEFL